MGNTPASEGEDMAESPRVATGELNMSKKKHRSLRKRLADKLKMTKSKKKYKEDLVIEEPAKQPDPRPQESSETLDKRRKLYSHLGIAKKGGSREEHMVPQGFKPPMKEPMIRESNTEKETKSSHSFIAIGKGKAIAQKDNESLSFQDKANEPERFSEALKYVGPALSGEAGVASNVKNSLAETKADEIDMTEESKFEITSESQETISENVSMRENDEFKFDIEQKNQPPPVKSNDEMRRKFLSRLTQEKVWLTPAEKPKSHQT
jgi:hypothetical protein